MGWTGLIPTEFKNGKIDKKAQMTKIIETDWNCDVIKCSLKGSVYYAAYQPRKRVGEIHGLVCLIRTRNSRWSMEFMYKDMDEEMGPCYYDCPKDIIKALSPTDNEWAMKWREKCLSREENNAADRLRKLAVGTVIKIGNTLLRKEAPAYQFKTAWYSIVGSWSYYPKSRIPANFEIIETA